MSNLSKYFLIGFLIAGSIFLSGCATKSSGPTKMESYNQKIYHSTQYGFSLEFPDSWKDNFAVEEKTQDNVTTISFLYIQLPGSEYPIFRLVVYPFGAWQNYKNSQELILNQQVFAYTNNYVFVLVRTLDNPYFSPQIEQFSSLNSGVSKVLQSFKLDAGKEFGLNKMKIYFNNTKLNSEMLDCRLTYPVLTSVRGTLPYEEQALRSLFAGPTSEQKAAGYESFFNSSTSAILNSLHIVENVALIDIKDIRKLIPNANSSCGSAQFLAEIENTLKEFPNIYQIYLAINGSPTKIYEWLQLGCTENNFYCDEKPFKQTVEEVDGADFKIPLVENATTTMPEEKAVTSSEKNKNSKQ